MKAPVEHTFKQMRLTRKTGKFHQSSPPSSARDLAAHRREVERASRITVSTSFGFRAVQPAQAYVSTRPSRAQILSKSSCLIDFSYGTLRDRETRFGIIYHQLTELRDIRQFTIPIGRRLELRLYYIEDLSLCLHGGRVARYFAWLTIVIFVFLDAWPSRGRSGIVILCS